MLPWDKDVCGRRLKLFMGILNQYKFRVVGAFAVGPRKK